MKSYICKRKQINKQNNDFLKSLIKYSLKFDKNFIELYFVIKGTYMSHQSECIIQIWKKQSCIATA